MLMEILLLFIPGILGVFIYKKTEMKMWDIWKYIEVYSIITFGVYFLNCILIYGRGWDGFSISTMGIEAQIKYGGLSITFVVVLSVLAGVFKNRIFMDSEK